VRKLQISLNNELNEEKEIKNINKKLELQIKELTK